MAHNFRFSRLNRLSLSFVCTTAPSFTKFLETARSTLRDMTLESIRWTSEGRFDMTETGEQAVEAVRVIGLGFDHLRNFSVLVYMKVCDWTY